MLQKQLRHPGTNRAKPNNGDFDRLHNPTFGLYRILYPKTNPPAGQDTSTLPFQKTPIPNADTKRKENGLRKDSGKIPVDGT
jgi:hypothetical protein